VPRSATPSSVTPSSVTPSSVRSQRMSLRRLAATTATVIAGSVLVAAPHASAATPDARPARPVAVRTSHTSHTAHTSHTSHLAARAATAQAAFGMQVLAEAARHDGAPYSYGAAGPSSFDCSGFTSYVYRQLGISLPRTSYAQYATTRHLPASLAVPGDLIFLDGLGHVAIYAGSGMMWDAPTPGNSVHERPIYGAYLVGRVRR